VLIIHQLELQPTDPPFRQNFYSYIPFPTRKILGSVKGLQQPTETYYENLGFDSRLTAAHTVCLKTQINIPTSCNRNILHDLLAVHPVTKKIPLLQGTRRLTSEFSGRMRPHSEPPKSSLHPTSSHPISFNP